MLKVKEYANFDEFEKDAHKQDVDLVAIVNKPNGMVCADLITDCKMWQTAVNRFFKALAGDDRVDWLTANDHAGAKNTGLSNDKIMCRLTIRTNGKIWRYLPWRTFCDKYNADRSVASTLKQTANDYLNWYVCESEIPVADFAKVEFLAEDGTYKDEKDIPGFALTDIAPELFE